MGGFLGADLDGTAQFFKGVTTVCTKLFNAVEVGDTLRRGAFINSLSFAARSRVLWPERHTASSFIKDSYVWQSISSITGYTHSSYLTPFITK